LCNFFHTLLLVRVCFVTPNLFFIFCYEYRSPLLFSAPFIRTLFFFRIMKDNLCSPPPALCGFSHFLLYWAPRNSVPLSFPLSHFFLASSYVDRSLPFFMLRVLTICPILFPQVATKSRFLDDSDFNVKIIANCFHFPPPFISFGLFFLLYPSRLTPLSSSSFFEGPVSLSSLLGTFSDSSLPSRKTISYLFSVRLVGSFPSLRTSRSVGVFLFGSLLVSLLFAHLVPVFSSTDCDFFCYCSSPNFSLTHVR